MDECDILRKTLAEWKKERIRAYPQRIPSYTFEAIHLCNYNLDVYSVSLYIHMAVTYAVVYTNLILNINE